MHVHHDIKTLPAFKNAVLTIGSFDGVHQGHQKILQRINHIAHQNNGESVVITFDPHPREVIFPNANDLQLLSDLEEKLALFRRYNIDHVVVVPFSVEFSQQQPREYVERFLIGSFNPSCIVIGYDHRFGLNREGNVDLLKSYEQSHNIVIEEIQVQELEEITISSTKIRNALNDGNISIANLYLNHFYSLRGKVLYGDKIGREIDFPTANVQCFHDKKLIPKEGVYAVLARLEDKLIKGMLYIGKRPTLGKDNRQTIEVNLFDFNENIYEEEIWIDFVEYIRDDIKFDSMLELKNQLYMDRTKSLKVLEGIERYQDKLAKTTVSILNYNGVELLESYLPSILYSSSHPIDIQVIDNASTDESIEYLNQWHPEIDTIVLEKNYGFAEGYNRGLIDVKTKYIALLNSDVQVQEKWLDPIIKLMEKDPMIACCQPKIKSLFEKTHFEYAGAAGGYIDSLGFPFCKGRVFSTVEEDKGQYNNQSFAEVFWTSGAAMVVRADIFKALHGFDATFFAHQEEIDFCWRVKRSGYKCMVANDVSVYHEGGATLSYNNPHKVYLNFRNNLAMIIKNEQLSRLIWVFPVRLLIDGLAGLQFLFKLQPKSTWAIIKAHFNIYSRILRLWKDRKLSEKLRQESRYKDNSKVGRMPGSILWQYYLLGRTKFSEFNFGK